jgi:outer membrane protein
MSKQTLLILLFQWMSICLFSQPGDTLELNYDEAITLALNESFTIKSHLKQKQASEHYFRYYKAMFKPRLDLSLDVPLWSESVSSIERADGLPVYNSNGTLQVGGNMSFQYILPSGGNIALSSNLFRQNLTTILASNSEELTTNQFYSKFWVSINQPVFTKNRLRENLLEAELQFQQSTYYFTRSQMDIVYRVTQGFYRLYKASMEVSITKEKLQNSKESFRIARLKSESGRIPKGDVLNAEVSVARDLANLLKVENQRNNEEDNFKHLIGLDINIPIKINTNLQYPVFEIDESKAVEEALSNRLEIKEDNVSINLQHIEVDRATREREIRGDFSAYYDLTGISTLETNNTMHLAESSIKNIADRPHNRGVIFTLSFPIYDWGRGRERVEQAKLILEEKKLGLEETKKSIVLEVREIIRTVRESHQQITIHEKNLKLARRTYEISKMRFENGDISSQELALDREQLANIQLDYLNAFITYQMAIADLKRKTMWDFEHGRSYLLVEE